MIPVQAGSSYCGLLQWRVAALRLGVGAATPFYCGFQAPSCSPGHRLAREVLPYERVFCTFRSITFAQRGQAVLRSAGIPVQLQRTPRWMEEKGCGYSLRLPPGYGAAAVEQLKQSGIPFSRLYLHRDDGGLEELKP